MIRVTAAYRRRVSLPYESRLAARAKDLMPDLWSDDPAVRQERFGRLFRGPIEDLEELVRGDRRVMARFLDEFPGYANRLLDGGPHPDQDLIDAFPPKEINKQRRGKLLYRKPDGVEKEGE